MSQSASLEIQDGVFFDVLNPVVDDIHIRHIAHALSNQCRFAGHTPRHYSVAEHSVYVSRMVPPEFAKQALMHDATEAYLTDLPSPIKRLWPEYYEMEKHLHRAIACRFEFECDMPPEVREADLRMCLTEKLFFFGPDGLDRPEWTPLTDQFEAYDPMVWPFVWGSHEVVPPRRAMNLFLSRYVELFN